MEVTVTGGAGNSIAAVDFSANDRAFIQAEALAQAIDSAYKTAITYDPSRPLYTPSYGYLVIPEKFATTDLKATGFGAIVDENNLGTSTIHGGDSTTGQTVIAGTGGLTYFASRGDNTVVAGGGANSITFLRDTGSNAAYTSTGNDSITGGNGQTTISAGAGDNQVFLHSGKSVVYSTGSDTITLATGGSDTINVFRGGSDVVLNRTHGHSERLTFIGGADSSTVDGGTGTYTIFGGGGGGVFHGGSDGNNLLQAGSGSATLIGGGAGDTLLGGSGSNLIRAGVGNETLGGGTGKNLFDVSSHTAPGQSGYGTIDTIDNFTSKDLIDVGGIRAVNYALNTYSVSDGGGSFLLEDGTQVSLVRATHPLSAKDFT